MQDVVGRLYLRQREQYAIRRVKDVLQPGSKCSNSNNCFTAIIRIIYRSTCVSQRLSQQLEDFVGMLEQRFTACMPC